MTNNKLYARDDYLKKKAADSNGLNIQLTNNYAFRKTFKNTYIAKGFLMALLGLKEDEIADLKVTDPFEEGESEQEKEGILDVKIYLNNNKKINIEMQNRYQNDWTERSLFYNCRMFTDGFYHGQSYGELEPCIHIGILDFNLMRSQGFHHHIKLLDIKTGEEYNDKLQFHVVQLKKLEDAAKEEKETELYYWAKLLAAKDWKEVDDTIKGNPYREAVKDEMYKMSQDERERYLYLREEMAYSDEISRMKTAREEGLEEGRKEGRKEGKQLFLQCIRLKKQGFSKEKIAEEIVLIRYYNVLFYLFFNDSTGIPDPVICLRRLNPLNINSYRAAAIRSPISFVPTSLHPSDMISPVRYPSVRTFCTAASTASASLSMSREKRSIIAAERMVAIGLALFCPAISGADPWLGS